MTTEKGKTQWIHFISRLRAIDDELDGPILDLGSGRGECVLAGLQQGDDAWGIETADYLLEKFEKLLCEHDAPGKWAKHCVLYDGHHMPFQNDFFSAVVSWYVLEHIPNLAEVLRETVRVLKPGGLIYFKAEDTRISYEGHSKIPWLPFMPKRFMRPWLEEFGKLEKLDYIENRVFAYTMDQVASILESFDCQIIDISTKPENLIPGHWQYHTESEIRQLARQLKSDFELGLYPEHQFPYIMAKKI